MTSRIFWLALLSIVVGTPLSALAAEALPPLEHFLAAAKSFNPSNREAAALVQQRRASISSVIGTLLPGINASGGYQRNEYQVAISIPPIVKNAVISPHNQWEGTATLAVPLVDVAAIFSVTAAGSALGATLAQSDATGLQVESQVTQAYFQLLANLALQDASSNALEVAQAGQSLTSLRLEGGRASKLELDRARAEVESRHQQVAATGLQLALSIRALASATGVAPVVGAKPPDLVAIVAKLPDDLGQSVQLEDVPQVKASLLQTHTYQKQAWASRLKLLPTLGGSFSERVTNAPGFTPRNHYWTANLNLKWRIDWSLVSDMRAADATLAVARAQQQRATQQALDSMYQAEQTIIADAVRAASAKVQAEVSDEAREVAQERYQAGSLTQLDLLQAQRDAFAAQVTLIQANADLLNAHAQLHLARGASLLPR